MYINLYISSLLVRSSVRSSSYLQNPAWLNLCSNRILNNFAVDSFQKILTDPSLATTTKQIKHRAEWKHDFSVIQKRILFLLKPFVSEPKFCKVASATEIKSIFSSIFEIIFYEVFCVSDPHVKRLRLRFGSQKLLKLTPKISSII